MYIMCLIIFKEKAEVQDQYPLSLNPVQKANDPIQDRNRNIGPMSKFRIAKYIPLGLSVVYRKGISLEKFMTYESVPYVSRNPKH